MPEGARTWRDRAVSVLFPVHWSFLLSQVALWSFVLLVVTGVYLALFYRPGEQLVTYDGSHPLYAGTELPQSFASVIRMSADLPLGELVRRVHRVATYIFLVALLAHLARVLLTGAFRRPRRLNYLLGAVLLLLGIATAYSGHLLPYDVVAGAGLQIAFALLSSIPLVGTELAQLAFGGPAPEASPVIVRVWVLHLFVLSPLLVAGTALHLVLVARQRHARLPEHATLPSVPVRDPLGRSVLLGLLTTAVLLAAAAVVPWSRVHLAGPFRAGFALNNLESDWYTAWPQGALRILPAIHLELGPVVVTNVLVAGVLLPGLVIALGLLYPWLEPRWRPASLTPTGVLQHPFADPVRLGLVTAWFTVVAVLAAGAADTVIAQLLVVPVSTVVVALRVALVLLPVVAGVLAWWYARSQGSRWELPAPEPAEPTERSRT